MLIDDVIIKGSSGKGGDGVVIFSKEMMTLGPTGGNGGSGGSVFIQGVVDIGALGKFRYKKKFLAGDGKSGEGNCRTGSNGEDLILNVPLGTVAHNLDTNESYDILKINEKILIARGGMGGRGNYSFRSSKNTSPTEFTLGKPGKEFNIRLELKLIADIGLIGLPNVGKSSLLNELTGAKSRVANYKFTTLEPHLGVYKELILADIPGLISGAASGKGLGFKFLRHIERTETIFHLISAESNDPLLDYEIINKELGSYNKHLLEKKEFIILTKSDTLKENELKKKISRLEKKFPNVIPISIYDFDKMKKLYTLLDKIIKETKYNETPQSTN